ncbi:MAG TPA: hypothetical protein VK703_04110 [Candidatus Acidoferrales bacterium]|nr:hypothetical protein [Candidatus Acidoferrales bacterium]
MRKLLGAALTVLVAVSLVACGGSKPPTPPTGPFSNASLNGQYAFSMSGIDLSGAYFARIGSFTADGNGNITGGLQDSLNLSSGAPASMVSFTSGTYEVQSNGRATATISVAGGGSLQIALAMQSATAGYIVETDLNASGSGTFNQQTSADFAAAALGHPYVFNVSGVSFLNTKAGPINMVGQLIGDGNGNITGGVMDTNDGNAAGPSGATAIAPGTYALDSNNGNGTSFGRGTMTFNGRTFGFYIVDDTHFKMLEEDTLGGSAGDALQQAATIPTENSQFTGSFVYLINGDGIVGTSGNVGRAARFSADGNGGVGTISLDTNNDGNYTHVSQGGNISAATYAIDTANSGSGRGTFTFKASGVATFSYVFYMISPAQAALLETSTGFVGGGTMYAQSAGPFTVSGSVGNYASGWSGIELGTATAVPYEEDYVVQYSLSSAGSSNISGGSDYQYLGLSTKTSASNVPVGGTLTIKQDGTLNNHYEFAVNGSPSLTLDFQAYFVNVGMVVMVCSDNDRTTTGVITQQ